MTITTVTTIHLRCVPRGADDARREAARLWNRMVILHHWFRKRRKLWPSEAQFKAHFKRRFNLHSQTIQALIERFFANIETCKTNRANGLHQRYPHRIKHFLSPTWKKSAITRLGNHLSLSMGSNRKPIEIYASSLPPGDIVQVTLDHGKAFVTLKREIDEPVSGERRAAVDLGIIHLAALTDGVDTEIPVLQGGENVKLSTGPSATATSHKLANICYNQRAATGRGHRHGSLPAFNGAIIPAESHRSSTKHPRAPRYRCQHEDLLESDSMRNLAAKRVSLRPI
jgi:hypothetical protein